MCVCMCVCVYNYEYICFRLLGKNHANVYLIFDALIMKPHKISTRRQRRGGLGSGYGSVNCMLDWGIIIFSIFCVCSLQFSIFHFQFVGVAAS